METPLVSETPAEHSKSALISLAALATVIVVGAIFAFNAADAPHWFSLFKWIHVSFVVFWVGGGLMLTVLGLLAERSRDPREIVTLAKWAAFAGERLFAPAGLVVLAMGIAMLIHGGDPIVHWGKFWVIAGLVGYASTFITGIAFLAPQAKKIHSLSESHGPEAPETVAAIKTILLIARVDIAVLLLVVADMVTKPFS
jgi:uncharacterized membrane protein